MTERLQSMIDSAPDYYQDSIVFSEILAAPAAEYDSIDAKNEDLRDQLYITRATWGLKYWEAAYRITTVLSDSYEIRRSRVLAARRGFGKFNAALVKRVADSFTNGDVVVNINIATSIVEIKFTSFYGTPPNLADVDAAIDNVIHAHLGYSFSYSYITLEAMETLTLEQLETYTMASFAPYV